jgi:hypothetical protein
MGGVGQGAGRDRRVHAQTGTALHRPGCPPGGGHGAERVARGVARRSRRGRTGRRLGRAATGRLPNARASAALGGGAAPPGAGPLEAAHLISQLGAGAELVLGRHVAQQGAVDGVALGPAQLIGAARGGGTGGLGLVRGLARVRVRGHSRGGGQCLARRVCVEWVNGAAMPACSPQRGGAAPARPTAAHALPNRGTQGARPAAGAAPVGRPPQRELRRRPAAAAGPGALGRAREARADARRVEPGGAAVEHEERLHKVVVREQRRLGGEGVGQEELCEMPHAGRGVDEREQEAVEERAAPLDVVLHQQVGQQGEGLARGARGAAGARGEGALRWERRGEVSLAPVRTRSRAWREDARPRLCAAPSGLRRSSCHL